MADNQNNSQGNGSSNKIKAKKNWILKQNKFHFVIKEGKPIPNGIPKMLLEALKTENVI